MTAPNFTDQELKQLEGSYLAESFITIGLLIADIRYWKSKTCLTSQATESEQKEARQ